MAKPVQHNGKWRIRWIDEHGRRQSEVFEKYRDAEAALIRHKNQVDEIKRGIKLSVIPDKTFSELCDYYLTHRTAEKRRQRDDESIIRVHLRPFFGQMCLRAIGVREIDAFKLSRKHLNKKTLHHLLTLFISMLRVAHDLRWLATLPKVKKPKLTLFERDFKYLRTEDEIARFLTAAHEEGPLAYALYSTAVYTGMRQGELAGLQWDDVDFESRRITVQRSFSGPTKSGEVRHVPILDPLLPVLREYRLRCQSHLVFPSESGVMQQESARIFQEVLHRILDRAGFPKTEVNGRVRRYIVFHSLRHTFASYWMSKRGPIFQLQKILGHKSPQMTQRYAHLAPDAFESEYSRLGTAPLVKTGQVISIASSQ